MSTSRGMWLDSVGDLILRKQESWSPCLDDSDNTILPQKGRLLAPLRTEVTQFPLAVRGRVTFSTLASKDTRTPMRERVELDI